MRQHCANEGPDHCVWCGQWVPEGWRKLKLKCPVTYRDRFRELIREVRA